MVVEAGRDVRDLSVVLPTTGKQIGEAENTGRGSEANFRANVVEVQGGGHLKVAAGGDRSIPEAVFGVKAQYLEKAFDEVAKRHGTIEAYFEQGLGIDRQGQERLREILLAGT